MLQFHEVPAKDRARLDAASAEVFAGLWAGLGVPVDRFYVDLYRSFGGRSAPDAQMVTLWPVERIVAERALATTIDGRRYDAIGDVMIDSDFLMVCLQDAAAPAYLRYAGDRIADSAVALVEAVVAERLAL